MAPSGPVPSKAALHALRGIIFGTSCSLVLLAEERRRRISIARSAVENGRKLKSLKCYSSSASSALEAIREDTHGDANLFNSSPAATRESRREHARWFWDKLDFNDADLDEAPPDPRKPQPTTRNEAVARDLTSSLANHTSTTTDSRPRRHPSKQRPDHLAFSLRKFFKTSSARSCSATTLDALEELRIWLQEERDIPQSTDATLELFRRACGEVPEGQPLPSWLCELSRHLCRAFQRYGDHSTAAEILFLLVSRGPLSLEAYLGHGPKGLIRQLCSTERVVSLPRASAIRQLRMAGQIFLANITNEPGYRLRSNRLWSDMARCKIVDNMIRIGMPDEALSQLRQLHQVCQFGFFEYQKAVKSFYSAGHFQQALDAFVDLSKFGPADDGLLSGRFVEEIFKALNCTDYHAALDVLNTMRVLGVEPTDSLDLRIVTPMLGIHWNKSRSLDQVRFLYDRIIGLLGTDVKHIYTQKTYQLHSAMIQTMLEAGEPRRAHAVYQELQRHRPYAGRDKKLISLFASGHARSGNWQAARQVLHGMHSLKPFNERQQEHYDEAWRQVFIEYGKNHTWGELEEFIEESAQLHEAPLLQSTIDLVVRRHGKRRSYKSLQDWIRSCQTRGFVPTKAFWLSLFSSAKNDWGYGTSNLQALYDEVKPCIHDPADCAVLDEFVGQQTARTTKIHVRTTMQPSQEAALYRQMRYDFTRKRWEGVLKAYSEAVNDGMGFSSRCLQLGVRSCIQTRGPRAAWQMVERAKAGGHDIAKASVPLDLAQLEQIRDQLQSRHTNDSEDRPNAYSAMQRLFTKIRDSGRPIDNAVFHEAARVCLSVRNYREAIKICHEAAMANNGGRDICYSVHSFAILSQAFAAQHEYGKLRILLKQMLRKEWRTAWYCQSSLKKTIFYLTRASESDKDEALKASDAQMASHVEEVLQSVLRDKSNLLAQVASDGASESDTDDYLR